MSTQNIAAVALPQTWASGFLVSNNATTPNTVLDISSGICRDSNNVMDLTVGVNNPNLEGGFIASPLNLVASGNGVNGLDTGSLAASTLYAVYIIGDSTYQQTTASILTLASNSAPLMPAGYDSMRLIGWVATDSSVHFLSQFTSGTANKRKTFYGASQIVLSAGTSSSIAGVALTALVPPVNNTPIDLRVLFAANAAGDIAQVYGYNQTASIRYIAQVAAGTADSDIVMPTVAQLNSAAPSLKYQLSTASAALTLYVNAYEYTI